MRDRVLLVMTCAALTLAACGDDGGGGSGDDDVGDDGGAGAVTFPLSFEVRGDVPLLIAIKNEGSPWQKLANASNGMYSVEVTRKHAIAFVCGSSDAIFQTDMVLRTTGDRDPFLFCYNFTDPAGVTHAVTGQMLQAGQVDFGDTDSGTTSPWNFDLMVSAGTHDLVAFGATKMQIQRDKVVNAATTLPTIDVATNGTAYDVTSVVVGNLEQGEVASASTSLFLDNAFVDYELEGTTLHSAPASLLNTNDFQTASITASTSSTRRTSSVDIGGTQQVTLLPRLSNALITFGVTGPEWVLLPEEMNEVTYSTSSTNRFLRVQASAGYLGADTSFDLDFDIPDFDPAWQVTLGATGTLIVYDEMSNSTSISSSAAVARLADRSRRFDALRTAAQLSQRPAPQLARLGRQLMR